jgi:hypothetical protein
MNIIFLIISGSDDKVCLKDLSIYKSMLELSTLYYEKMREKYNFNYFFCEFNNDISETICQKDHFIYIKGKEEFHKIYEKTVRSIDFINKNYTYDFLVRTNISSFWNIDNLFKISNQLPSVGCLAGVYMFNHFISGTGIILSRDVCEYLLTFPIGYFSDDVLISDNLKRKYSIYRLDDSVMYFSICDKINIPDNIDNILYFRIKNNNRVLDIEIFKILLRKIYNINC